MTNTAKLILRSALDFVTEREIPGNQGWEDPRFETLMKLTGWQMGEAWCTYFIEAILITVGLKEHAKVISAGAVQTFNNCKVSPLFKIHSVPEVGDIVIWQNYKDGKPDWSGHAGICVAMGKGLLVCVEGNSNAEGAREGIEVAIKLRNPQIMSQNGLQILGFIGIII